MDHRRFGVTFTMARGSNVYLRIFDFLCGRVSRQQVTRHQEHLFGLFSVLLETLG
jgi:hypothetical protein